MRRNLNVLALLLLVDCTRDLSIPAAPPAPGPGSLYGRVVVSVPGHSQHVAAVGATVALLGSSLSTTAGTDGNFRLDGVDQTSGSVLFRFAVDGTTRQRLIGLADIGAGPSRQISLGDVLVVDNASLHGIARRADVMGSSGHGGTAVFVPQGPFTTYTGDDGSFLLENLPEGTLQLALFRPGYAPVTRDDLQLRSGEDFALQTIELQVAPPSPPGSISGRVRFNPATTSIASTQVSATPIGGAPLSGAAMDDGTFSVTNLPAGVYDLNLSHDGYTPAIVNNVLVTSSDATQVSDVLLTEGAAFDAGVRLPVPDAGPPQTSDAGVCTATAQCTSTQWCDPDFGICRPQCTSMNDCSNGRVCDLPTGTCAVPCAPGCSSGHICDVPTQTCLAVCDVSTPCASGFKCTAQNVCVHECAVTQDCLQAHRMCQAGACVSDGTCDSDLDCPTAQLCAGPACANRTGPLNDAGFFLCATACSCRLDEACESGACVPSQVPTRYLTSDGGGLGLTPGTASSDLPGLVADGGVLALRAGDVFNLAGPLLIDAGVTVAGGFVDCGPTRWVRDSRVRTTLTVPNGTVVNIGGIAQSPVADVALRNLFLVDAVGQSCLSLVEASYAPRLTLQHVAGTLPFQRTGCSAGLMGILECDHCDAMSLDDVALAGAVPTASSSPVGVARLTNVSGTLKNLSSTGVQASSSAPVYGVSVAVLTGPLDIKGGSFDAPQDAQNPAGIGVTQCSGFPVTVTGATVQIPVTSSGFEGIVISSCENATVSGNRIDGSQGANQSNMTAHLIHFLNSGGAIDGNTLLLPSHIDTGGSSFIGIFVEGLLAPASISNNTVSGGVAQSMYGVELSGVDSSSGPDGGALHVESNQVTLGACTASQALSIVGVAASAGLVVRDNRFSAGINHDGCGVQNVGLYATNSSGLFERNRFFSPGSDYPVAAYLTPPGQVEFYENHFWAGRTWHGGNCGGPAAALVTVATSGTLFFYAIGNTIDGDGDVGADSVGMNIASTTQLLMRSNIISGGQTATATVLVGSAFNDAVAAGNFKENYLYLPNVGQSFATGDLVPQIASGDAGLPDGAGNIRNIGSCFDLTQPVPRYKLAAGTPCIKNGFLGARQDGTAISNDIDGTPRSQKPDIGCSQKP